VWVKTHPTVETIPKSLEHFQVVGRLYWAEAIRRFISSKESFMKRPTMTARIVAIGALLGASALLSSCLLYNSTVREQTEKKTTSRQLVLFPVLAASSSVTVDKGSDTPLPPPPCPEVK